MESAITSGHYDLALVLLYVFWVFFFGLIIYLRREDRREGYPMETDGRGRPAKSSWIFIPDPKEFALADGSTVMAPSGRVDDRPVRAEPVGPFPGAPLDPVGDPMKAEVGPGAYAQRDDKPDLSFEGEPKIVPLRLAPHLSLEKRDPDPRGMEVVGCDGAVAGTVTDVWVDRAEILIRYLEVEVPGAAPAGAAPLGGEGAPSDAAPAPVAPATRVLVPMPLARIDGMGPRELHPMRPKRVKVNSITAAQFAGVPTTNSLDQVTRLEEDRISAYFAAGKLYATPDRVDPFV